MKKIIVSLMCLLLTTSLWAQMTSVVGTVNRESVTYTHLNLMRIQHGAPIVIGNIELAADGAYGFLFTPTYEGMYAIGSENIMEGQFEFYAKKGEQISLNIDGVDAALVGNLSEENKSLQAWYDLSREVRFKSLYFNKIRSTYVDFFPALESTLTKVRAFKEQIHTSNPTFNTFMKEYVDMTMDFYALNFLSTPRTAHPDATIVRPAIYNTMVRPAKFASNEIMRYLYGKRHLSAYLWQLKKQNPAVDDATMLTYLSNDEQKATFLIDYSLRNIKSHDQFTAFDRDFSKHFVAPAHKAFYESYGANLYASEIGKPASDFTYPDINGKQVSLSDFKGKVVLVDVWATWCGPCKAEFPALRKLHEEMHGKDVVIISVSIDEVKNKDKWLQMLKDEDLSGVQLFAGGWETKITKDYKIKGIPRFMVFDKKGNVVSTEAPRPSDPALKQMLLNELKK